MMILSSFNLQQVELFPRKKLSVKQDSTFQKRLRLTVEMGKWGGMEVCPACLGSVYPNNRVSIVIIMMMLMMMQRMMKQRMMLMLAVSTQTIG